MSLQEPMDIEITGIMGNLLLIVCEMDTELKLLLMTHHDSHRLLFLTTLNGKDSTYTR